MIPLEINSELLIISSICCLMGILLLIEFALEQRNRVNQRLKEKSRERLRDRASQSRLFKDWKTTGEQRLEDHDLWDQLHQFLEQAGGQITIWQLLRISVWTAGLFAITGYVAGQHIGWAVGSALLGSSLPFFYVYQKRQKRIAQLRDQLPEAFDLMSRAVQAGQTIPAAFVMVSRQCPSPVADEFQYCNEQQNLGLPYEVTLRDMARRTGVMELQMFAVAMILQRQAGGNPIELLDNLSGLVRSRTNLAMKVKALTSEGRMQAWVLSLLPIVSLIGLYFLDRNYAMILLNEPKLLLGLAVSIGLGILWIRRIVCFEY